MKDTLDGRQGHPRRDFANRAPLNETPPSTARGIRVPDPRANFFPAWMRQWANWLHQICKSIERQSAAGRSVRKAARHCAWVWKSRSYRTAPQIKVRFAQATLVNRYYQWLREGKSPDCFVLHYADRLAPVTPEIVRGFVVACATPGVTRWRQARKLTDLKGLSFHRVFAALPTRMRRVILDTFTARKQAEIDARKFLKGFQGQLRRLLAADGTRSRRVKKLADSFETGRGGSGVESTSRRANSDIQASQGPLQANWKGVTHVS